ncbi:hypothetical protein [Agrobacterium tumefaciens]|uniref:hypothetical protein n=1 Tax=Agrobacterium tumefaciens TaxID=358 RepID=UPI0023406156|nr:hypothetical protein [Agrobacterium tumefaciens]WCK02772.1 hypothetical protein G6L31_002695 [Agrobacterium tumefaciens]
MISLIMISILNPKRHGADRSPMISADAALRRLSKANMGWFRRSAKIAVWRLTVHHSLTMPPAGALSGFDFDQGEDGAAGEI